MSVAVFSTLTNPFVLFQRYSYNSIMNFELNRCLNNFFQKIIGDTLTVRLSTGNNFTLILYSLYRFLFYHLPCSLYFSVGNWFYEGALHYPHWLWTEFPHYSGQKDLLLLMYGDLKCDCFVFHLLATVKRVLCIKSDK